ncbi:MAG: leucine-rich repeat protein [Firmicutes bacterium]|nr:leucine-rich repeat protein [Bacillota bacterium]
MSSVGNLAKVTYEKLLKYDFVWNRRAQAKNFVANVRKIKYNKFRAKQLHMFGKLDISDTTFEYIDIEDTGRKNDVVFGFDTLGQIKSIPALDHVEYCSSLQGVLSADDIDIRLSITEDPDFDPEILKYFKDEMNLYTLTPDTGFIIRKGQYKAAFFGLQMPKDGDLEAENILSEQVLKNIIYCRQQDIDYIVAYALREYNNSIPVTPYEKAYMRSLANSGCDAIFCANEGWIHAGANTKKLNGKYSDSIASMGSLFGEGAEVEGAAMAIRIKLLPNVAGDERFFVNKGYIPMYNNKLADGTLYSVTRIDYHNSEHRRNKDMMEALKYIEDATFKHRDIRNILTINDICEILEVELPEKYRYLANVSVGKVCARSFEVNSGDVFFFRQPFSDKNDGEPAPLEERLRIVDKALGRGARFVFSYADLGDKIPHIKVDNAREAHITVCAHLRQMYEVRTVGITGSVGKTSTKDMLYNVLNEKYATFRNLRNSNTQVNIGMHIQDFRGGYEFFIQEIGGGRPGGASRHSRMILPEATIVTNIGHAHLGNYGTQEKLMESKLGIVEGMDEKGTLYLNADDPLLRTAKVDADTVFFAVNNKEADYYADNITEDNGQTFFEIVHGDHRVPAMLNVLGEYNVLNAVCCYAIGKKFGLTDEQIVAGISKFETSGVRQNLMTIAGYDLFVDCFNASPRSIETSLSVLEKIETDNRKIAVIGDVTGMAEMTEEIHVEIGEIVTSKKMDKLICYGESSKIVHKMALEAGIDAVSITDPKELEKTIMQEANEGDVILFKGSGKMKFTERIDNMFGTMLADQGYVDKMAFRKVKESRVRYNAYENYATVTGCVDFNGTVKIAKSVMGVPVYNLGEGAFSDKENVREFKLPDTIRHIGAGCFYGCGMIKTVEIPRSVKYIGESAFAECSLLEKIELPEGVMQLDDKVFYGCTELKEVYLPASIRQMGEDIFDNCDSVTVYCKEGSYAAQYCAANGVHHKLV